MIGFGCGEFVRLDDVAQDRADRDETRRARFVRLAAGRMPTVPPPYVRASRFAGLETTPAKRCGKVEALLQNPPSSVEMGPVRGTGAAMSDFKGCHFEGEVVLWAVRGIAATG